MAPMLGNQVDSFVFADKLCCKKIMENDNQDSGGKLKTIDFIPEMFSSYEKVIYLDCDLICCADIAELYKTNLGDNLLAAARDSSGIKNYHLKIKELEKGFRLAICYRLR
jgi:alpha-N-acetylglucosamine transferase